jgi:hypothetical protein
MEVYMKIFAIILVVLAISGCGLLGINLNQGQELNEIQRSYIIHGREYLAENPGKTWADWDVEANERAAVNGPRIVEYLRGQQQTRALERIADAAEWQSIERMFPQPVIIVPNR